MFKSLQKEGTQYQRNKTFPRSLTASQNKAQEDLYEYKNT